MLIYGGITMTYAEAYELYRTMWKKKLTKGNRSLKPAKTAFSKEPDHKPSESTNPVA